MVYRDWADFAKSAVWVIALPLGILWLFENRSDFLFRCAGLALFGRVVMMLLLVFALGRLQEKLEQYKRGELGVIRGVLIPLIVFAWMFNYLIRPMIQTERWRW